MKVEKAGCILLDLKNKKVALVYREKKNDYSFPKGHLEKYETLESCAIRETEEETGRKCRLLSSRPVAILEYTTPEGKEVEAHYFLASDEGASSQKFPPELAHEMVWKSAEEVSNLLTYPNLMNFWSKIRTTVINTLNSIEIWDVYDEHKQKTGKTIIRGEELSENEYHISVHIWIVNDKNEFLIQKRSANKNNFPNMWSMTGGGVLAGEESREGCKREIQEELRIDIDLNNLEIIGTIKRNYDFVDIWLLKQNINIKDIVIQKEELSEVKWASKEEISKLILEQKFTPSVLEGYELCLNYIYDNQ